MLSSLDWGRHEDALPEPLRGRTCCPAGKGVMGREPLASRSFRLCLSRVEPDACPQLCSSQGRPHVVNELAGGLQAQLFNPLWDDSHTQCFSTLQLLARWARFSLVCITVSFSSAQSCFLVLPLVSS